MKKNSIWLALPFLLAACQSEPEVGSTLFPDTTQELAVQAFIDNHAFFPKNTIATRVVQTGAGELSLGEDRVELRVQLTNAAPTDLTFSMQVDNSKLSDDAKDATPLEADAIAFERQTVTVKQGALESEEPIVFSLNASSASLKGFTDKAAVALALTTKNDVRISERYDSYTWKVSKEITNINAQGTLEGKTEIPVTDYDVLDQYHSPTMKLSDGKYDTYVLNYIGSGTANRIPIRLREAQDVVGVAIYPSGFWNAWNLTPSKVEILGSETEDGELKRIGIATWETTTPTDNTPWNIAFYSPVKVKVLHVRVLDNFSGGSSENVLTGELRLYK